MYDNKQKITSENRTVFICLEPQSVWKYSIDKIPSNNLFLECQSMQTYSIDKKQPQIIHEC